MIDPDVETDVRNFIASLARLCKGCIRMGYACATCPCSRATVLHEHEAGRTQPCIGKRGTRQGVPKKA